MSDAAGHSEDDASIRHAATVYIYLPTAFILTIPFAFMTWGPAHVAWIAVTIAVFILASFLMWSMGARQAPVLSGWLLLYFLLTSELIIEVGNAAGIAVSLCVIAVWSFLQERFVPVGIFFLAISLPDKTARHSFCMAVLRVDRWEESQTCPLDRFALCFISTSDVLVDVAQRA